MDVIRLRCPGCFLPAPRPVGVALVVASHPPSVPIVGLVRISNSRHGCCVRVGGRLCVRRVGASTRLKEPSALSEVVGPRSARKTASMRGRSACGRRGQHRRSAESRALRAGASLNCASYETEVFYTFPTPLPKILVSVD